jgi:hypothetical protein
MPGSRDKLLRLVESQRAVQEAARKAANDAREKREEELRVQKALSSHQDKQRPNVSDATDV